MFTVPEASEKKQPSLPTQLANNLHKFVKANSLSVESYEAMLHLKRGEARRWKIGMHLHQVSSSQEYLPAANIVTCCVYK